MAKMTLLEIVKDILTDMNSDKVNSINDTTESEDVAQIVKTCYFEMIGHRNWPHLRKLSPLESLSDVTKPNYLKIPENFKEMENLTYNVVSPTQTKTVYKKITYKEPDDFLTVSLALDSSKSTVQQISDFSSAKILINNNQAPSYWTSFDNKYVVLDSFDNTAGATVLGSRSQCLAYVEPEWSQLDDFIPDLPSEAFPALLEEAKSTSFLVIKQVGNQKAEQKAARQNRWLSRKAWTAKGGIVYPSYGRTSRK